MPYDPDQDPSLTVISIANRLNVSEATVYNMVKQGKIPYHRAGKKQIRFSETDYREYLQSIKQQEKTSCPNQYGNQTENGRSAFKTKNEVSHDLSELLKQKNKPKNGKQTSKQKALIVCSDVNNGEPSVRH